MQHVIRLAVLALALGTCATAHAQAGYPNKPLRLVNGFPAGGPSDIFARIIAQKLGEVIGQQVIVDNRAGANGLIAAEHVAKSAPADGYTFFLSPCAVLAIHPHLYAKMPVEPKDFAPVTVAVAVPEMLAVHPSLPVKSARDLVRLAKAKPGQLVYGSAGSGGMPNLASESFKIAAGINIVHVPYKGAAPAVVDLLGGHLDLTTLDLPVLLPHVKSGKLRALAVATAKRAPLLPEVPTMAEAGYPEVNADNWYGVVVAAATPKDVVAKLHAALMTTLQSPEVKQRLAAQGAEAVPSTPEHFAAFIQSESAKWGKVIKTAGIKLD
ncbi:MAG TPA: tripartite tricarboxylate transporter substrate binding protein [Burkholderiales bacterium]|nr:tripartite tricarboxylate transporter substrate binding protein [Burkholderiales bacterium]